jgi:hypothetical protein
MDRTRSIPNVKVCGTAMGRNELKEKPRCVYSSQVLQALSVLPSFVS